MLIKFLFVAVARTVLHYPDDSIRWWLGRIIKAVV